MITVRGPRSPRGFRSLRGWAILQKAVTATGVDIDHALIAAANRTNAGVPFPRCRRPVPLGRILRVDVRVDIGLCIRRLYPDDHRQDAEASDQSALHDFLLWTTHAVRREHEVDVPNCQVKFSLNIAAVCLLARNEANQPTARDCAPWLPVRPELALR